VAAIFSAVVQQQGSRCYIEATGCARDVLMDCERVMRHPITGLKFFFDVTLDRSELMAKMKPVFVPRTLPVVLSREEVSALIAAMY